MAQLTEEEKAIMRDLCHDVRQFQKDPQAHLRYPDIEEVTMSLEELIEAIVQEADMDVRLKGVAPRELARRLSTEDRLEGLSPQEMFKSMSPEMRTELQTLMNERAQPSQQKPKAQPRRRRT